MPNFAHFMSGCGFWAVSLQDQGDNSCCTRFSQCNPCSCMSFLDALVARNARAVAGL